MHSQWHHVLVEYFVGFHIAPEDGFALGCTVLPSFLQKKKKHSQSPVWSGRPFKSPVGDVAVPSKYPEFSLIYFVDLQLTV